MLIKIPPLPINLREEPINLNTKYTGQEVQDLLMQNPEHIRSLVNAMIDTLNTNGAEHIGATVSGLSGTNVLALLQSLKNITDNLNTVKADKATTYLRTEIDTKVNTVQNNLSTHKNSSDHDGRYYTKDELAPYLQGGDTFIKYEIFNIINADNGDGTFTYQAKNGERVGALTPEGYQVFELETGYYLPGNNRIECWVNDTLHRSEASGGLKEVSSTSFALTMPEGSGAEITVRYFERIGITGEHNVIVGENKPPQSQGNTLWFKVVG